MIPGKTVVVAMSGGVDSSVAAAVLKSQGYRVIGMMLRLWSEPGAEDSNRCCTPDAIASARRVAAQLEIPFYVVDGKRVFRDVVVRYFLDGYARGGTPNPCLVCNKQIRWKYLLEHALALGADFLATGHYARTLTGDDGAVRLLRAVDAAKDQSYVLHVLDQVELSRAIFPVGDYTKTQVRELAATYDLPTAAQRDSQDLCFLAGGDYRDFLRRQGAHAPLPGKIVSQTGQVLGQHGGLADYTIGQRKGLGLRSEVPLYVISKDGQANTLVVGPGDALGRRELVTGDVNWISGRPRTEPFRGQVKTRYTAKEASATVHPATGSSQVQIVFDEPQRDITPGQAAVFYEGEVVVGGGIIE